MNDGFLGRWSQRKLAVQQGKPVDTEPVPVALEESVEALPPPAPAAPSVAAPDAPAEAQAPPPPTLDDVTGLTPASDFRRFAARDVAPEVKNAAMKKLFTDPRFNVMDGLDVYTGDYSQADPLPEAMLRQLASAGFLRLFEEPPAEPAREVAYNPGAETMAHSQTPSTGACEPPDHADPHLQLQPDHAAPGEDPGAGAG